MNLLNIGNESVTLKTQKYRNLGLFPITGQLGTLAAGEGRLVMSHEHERWAAFWTSGGVAKEWNVDIANGHVQDVVFGF